MKYIPKYQKSGVFREPIKVESESTYRPPAINPIDVNNILELAKKKKDYGTISNETKSNLEKNIITTGAKIVKKLDTDILPPLALAGMFNPLSRIPAQAYLVDKMERENVSAEAVNTAYSRATNNYISEAAGGLVDAKQSWEQLKKGNILYKDGEFGAIPQAIWAISGVVEPSSGIPSVIDNFIEKSKAFGDFIDVSKPLYDKGLQVYSERKNDKNTKNKSVGKKPVAKHQQGETLNRQATGKKPYITHDPDDPRIQKYQDSLNAYNFGEDHYKFTKGIYDLVRAPINNEFRKNYDIVPQKAQLPSPYKGLLPIEHYSEDYVRKPLTLKQRIFGDNVLQGYVDGVKDVHYSPVGTGWSRWKKPEEEVIYKELPSPKPRINSDVVKQPIKSRTVINPIDRLDFIKPTPQQTSLKTREFVKPKFSESKTDFNFYGMSDAAIWGDDKKPIGYYDIGEGRVNVNMKDLSAMSEDSRKALFDILGNNTAARFKFNSELLKIKKDVNDNRKIKKHQSGGKLTFNQLRTFTTPSESTYVQPAVNKFERDLELAEIRESKIKQREKELAEYSSKPNMVSGMKRKPTASEITQQATASVDYNNQLRNDPVGTLGPDLAMALIPEAMLLKTPQQLISKGFSKVNSFKNLVSGVNKNSLNTLENLSYEFSTFPKKMSPSYQKKAISELKEANEWQKNWYSHPETKQRLRNLSNEFNFELQAGINKSWRRRMASKNKPPSQNEWDLLLKRADGEHYTASFQSKKAKLDRILKGDKSVHSDNVGISGHNIDSDYKGIRQNLVDKYSPDIISNAIHEGNHGWTDGDKLIPFKEKNNIAKIFQDDSQVPKVRKAYEEYLQDPAEVYARIMELRKHMNLKPGEVVTNRQFFKLMSEGAQKKTPVDPLFFKLINDPHGFKELFNRLPVIFPAVIGTSLLKDEPNAKNT